MYGLGIDTGGTYTDAAIMNLNEGVILSANKALTTHKDLIVGIRNCLNGLNTSVFSKIKFVAVSTTLATNTTLEKKGYPCGLIEIGFDSNGLTPAEFVLNIPGGHDSNGNELESPKEYIKNVDDFIETTKGKVASYAISSYFGTRNPEHEILIRDHIQNKTSLPVVCGHELSQSLGFSERSTTAVLNAQLIPVITEFLGSIKSVLKKEGISATIMVMKCDGSLVNIDGAVLKPVETIFSGPAASLVGAAYLTKTDKCIAIDIGGTSTDISMISNNMPDVCEDGAVVGGWKTKVKAIKITTSALGGDSHIWYSKELHFGPNRVVPLCLCASEFPEIIDVMNGNDLPSERIFNSIIQKTTFFMKNKKLPFYEMSENEKELYDNLAQYPLNIIDIGERVGKHPILISKSIKSLVQKDFVTMVGFTPTDALHITGEYIHGNREASLAGARLLGEVMGKTPEEVGTLVKSLFTKKVAYSILNYFLPLSPKETLNEILDASDYFIPKVKIPIVLIGAPVSPYADDLKHYIDSEVYVPEYYSIGNAIGALVGNIILSKSALLRLESYGSNRYILFSTAGRYSFETYREALEFSEKILSESIYEELSSYGINSAKISLNELGKKINKKGIILEVTLQAQAVVSPIKSGVVSG